MPEKRKKSKSSQAKHHAARKTKAVNTRRTSVHKKAAKAAKTKKVTASKTKKGAAAPAAAKEGSLNVFDLKGKTLETIKLDPIFGGEPVNTDVIYQAVLMYQAGEREGTAATKTRGEVRGGGKKPWKQKGTGQARHGSRRSPIWRGGGAVFGPHPRDYSYSIASQMKRRAVVESMKDKVANGKLIVVNDLDVDQPRTKLVAGIMSTFKLEKPLMLVEKKSNNMVLASRNISQVALKTASEVNALDVVSHKECLISKGAYSGLVKRLKA